jgi:hypothetical protein
MSIVLRILLIIGSLAFTTNAIRKIRSSAIEIGDALFWIVFSFFLLLISIFPDIIFLAAKLFGIQLPVNMVFLCVIALLAYKSFSLSIKISALSMKLKALTAMLATQQAIDSECLASEQPAETREATNPVINGADHETPL